MIFEIIKILLKDFINKLHVLVFYIFIFTNFLNFRIKNFFFILYTYNLLLKF